MEWMGIQDMQYLKLSFAAQQSNGEIINSARIMCIEIPIPGLHDMVI